MTHSPSDNPISDALDTDGAGLPELPDLPDMAGAPENGMTEDGMMGDEALLSGVFVDMAEDEVGDSDVLVEVDTAFDTPDLEDFGASEDPPERADPEGLAPFDVPPDMPASDPEPEIAEAADMPEALCEVAEDDPTEAVDAPEEAPDFDTPASPNVEAMAPLPEDDGEDDLRGSDVGRLLSNTERELNRRFDDVELVVMELLQMFSAPPDPERPDSLPMQVQDGFARLESALSSTGTEPAAEATAPSGAALPEALATRLDSFEDLLRQAMARSARRRQRQKERVASRQDQMQAWLQEALAALQAGIDGLAAREDAPDAHGPDRVGPDTMALLGDLASGQSALQAALEGLATPDLAPLQAQLQTVQDSLSDLVARPVAEPVDAPAPDTSIDPDQLARVLSSELAGPLADPLRIELEQGLDRVVSLLGAQDHQQQAERKGLLALRQGLEGVATRLDGALASFETRLETLQPAQDSPAEDPRQEAERKALSTLRHGMETMLDRMDGLLACIETTPETDQDTGKTSEQFEALQAGSAALSEQVQQIMTRLESGLGRPVDLDPLRLEMGRGTDRLASLLGERDARLEAERKGLVTLRRGLESTVGRLEGALGSLEDRLSAQTTDESAEDDPLADLPVQVAALQDRLDSGLAALAEAAPEAPDLAALLDPLRASLDHGVERILAALTTQGRRLEAERRVLSQLLGGADQVLSRLEAATHRLEQTPPPAPAPEAAPAEGSALEARLAGLEATLAAMQAQMADSQPPAPAADGTAEALRDLSMLLAEMMARQERLLHEAGFGAGIGAGIGAAKGAGDGDEAEAARSA